MLIFRGKGMYSHSTLHFVVQWLQLKGHRFLLVFLSNQRSTRQAVKAGSLTLNMFKVDINHKLNSYVFFITLFKKRD